MDLKTYLIDTFQFNSRTNKKLLKKIRQLRDQEESIRFFSHLINSQYKWLARIKQDPMAAQMSWWDPVYPFSGLEKEWDKSLTLWLDYLQSKTEEELSKEVEFTGYDGGKWMATPKDIALQLNYHSIHHRAQIQMLIRAQGVEPDFVDYIGTKYRKIK
jgi:uncharacterized damage-inducible protein DinB